MSDSLLNLLEILDEVVAEQESGGGAPDFTKLENDIDNFILYSKEVYTQILSDEMVTNYRKQNTKQKWEKYEKQRTSQHRMERLYAAYELLVQTSEGKEKVTAFAKNITEHIFLLNTNFLRLQSGNPHEVSHQPIGNSYSDFFKVYQRLCENNSTHNKVNLNRTFFQLADKRMVYRLEAQTKIKGGQSTVIITEFLNNLSKGIGAYRVSMNEGARTMSDQLADNVKILDYLDFRAMKGEMSRPFATYAKSKKSHFSYILKQINSVRKLLGEPEKSLLLNLVKNTFSDIFELALENEAKNTEWSSQINFLLTGAEGLNKFEETRDYAIDWAKKFVVSYPNVYGTNRSKFKQDATDDIYQSMIDDIKPNLGKTFTSPKINLSGGSLSNDFLSVVDNFFDSSANNFDSRKDQFVQKMSIFLKDPKEFQKELSGIGVLDFMNRVLLMDYFVEFSKGFTNVTAGVLFEYFLAGLFNGEVVGHLQGVTDFKVGKELYSAKFIAPETTLKQKLSRFQAKEAKGKTITFIVGKKLKSYKARNKKKGDKEYQFGVEEIHDVKLYKFQIKYTNGDFFVDGGNESAKKLNLVSINSKNEVVMDEIISQLKPFTQIRIMSTDKDTIKTYREALKEKLKGSTEELIEQKKNILNIVQAIFDNLKEGESSARKYVSSGDKEQGVRATKKLDVSKKGIIALSGAADEYKLDSEPDDA